MVELRLIRYAMTLADLRNFARAAEALGITQPSLSRGIAQLEDELGVLLFERRRDGVVPTAAGGVLIGRGAALLAGASELEAELGGLAGADAPRLAVGAGAYAAEISVGTALARLLGERPQQLVDVSVDDPGAIVAGVQARRFDVGVATVRAVDVSANLYVESLPTHPLLPAVRPGHPLAGRDGLSLPDVLAYPVASSLVTGDLAAATATFAGAGFVDHGSGHLRPPIHVNHLSLARRIALETDAILAGTAAMLRDDLEAGRLVRLDFRLDPLRTSYSLIWNRDRPRSTAAARFTELVRDVEREIAEAEAADSRIASVAAR
jgi:DNA-binding transcriptional LysR family regulator